MIPYLIIFLAGGLVGWMLDTLYRSLEAKKYAPGTWLPFFSIIYGTGGAILFFIFSKFPFAPVWQIALGTLSMIFLELSSGLISIKFLHKRLWDYTRSKYDFLGLVDLLHSFYWLVLVIIFRLTFSAL